MSLVLDVRDPTSADFLRACLVDTSSPPDPTPISRIPLSSSSISTLLSRVSEQRGGEGEGEGESEKGEIDSSRMTTPFFQREKSLAAPKTGSRITLPFPPPPPSADSYSDSAPSASPSPSASLEIVRSVPTGDNLPSVPHIQVVFNHPLIPLSSRQDLSVDFPIESEEVGVGVGILSCSPPLTDCPRSTNYEITIRQGLTSMLDSALSLGEPYSFSFSTQLMSLQNHYPKWTDRGGSSSSSSSSSSISPHLVQDLCEVRGDRAMLYLEFNQGVREDVLLQCVRVEGYEGTLCLLSLDEVEDRLGIDGFLKRKRYYHWRQYWSFLDRSRKRIANVRESESQSVDFVWIGFEKGCDLEKGKTYSVVVPAGSYSSEGPRESHVMKTEFRTYGKFSFVRKLPRKKEETLPLGGLHIHFSNNIDLEEFEPSHLVRVNPEVPGLNISASGSVMSLRGRTRGNVAYTVTVSEELTDVFGQKLGNDVSVVFDVGPARQSLSTFHQSQVIVHDVTMQGDDPTFSIVSCNLERARVCVFQVHPSEFHKSSFGPDYRWHSESWDRYADRTSEETINAGTRVFDEVVQLETPQDEVGETLVHLREHLQHPVEILGQVVVYVEPHQPSWHSLGPWKNRPRVRTWLQVTRTAVDAFATNGCAIYGFVTNLADGSSLGHESESCTFTVQSPKSTIAQQYDDVQISVPADGEGMGHLVNSYRSGSVLWATRGNDVVFVSNLSVYNKIPGRMLAYVINDRMLYKPKETVSVKGILRQLSYDGWKKVLSVPVDGEVTWQAFDSRRNKFGNGTVALNDFGSFFLQVELPDNVNLGDASIRFQKGVWRLEHAFKIQEFRTPEFTAVARVNPGPYFYDGVAIITGAAEYFSGGGMQGCDAKWEVNQVNATYRPPGFAFAGFSFGCGWRPLRPPEPPEKADKVGGEEKKPLVAPVSRSLPPPRSEREARMRAEEEARKREEEKMRRRYMEEKKRAMEEARAEKMRNGFSSDSDVSSTGNPESKTSLEGTTNAEGEHKCCIEFEDNLAMEVKVPVTISSKVNIQDINRQTMGASASFLVHPSSLYVGLKLKKSYCKAGEPLPLDLVVTDLDGDVIAGAIVTLRVLLRWTEKKGYVYAKKESVLETMTFPSEAEPKELTLRLAEGGRFYIVASVLDDQGRPNFASASIYVAGPSRGGPKAGSRIRLESIQMIANQKEYHPGDVANILITAPFDPPAEGVLLVMCNGFAYKKRFALADLSVVVPVPIRREYIPGVDIRVSLAGAGERIDEMTGRPSELAPKRPAFASGTLHLNVPAAKNTIECTVTNESIMKPGEEGVIHVQLSSSSDDEFDPSGSRVSCIIVDEAILSLTGYSLPHPISTFYPENGNSLQMVHLRSSVVMKDWSSIRVQPAVDLEEERRKMEEAAMRKAMMEKRRRMEEERRRCEEERCCRMRFAEEREMARRSAMEEAECERKSHCCREACQRKRCEEECRCRHRREKECCCRQQQQQQRQAHQDTKPESLEEFAPIEVRSDFCPLACFVHDTSIEDSHVDIAFTLPDQLTRYRIFVLCTKGRTHFGLGESSLQTQLPVAIRPSLPRFLNFGDTAEFCVVLQNQASAAITVDVAVEMLNLSLADPSMQGFRVEIPLLKRAEVRFPVGTEGVGEARFQVVAAVPGTSFADAVVRSLPVFTPATTEGFACYGEVDNDGVVRQAVLPPSDVFRQFGGMTITTSSTALQSLTDAFLYLIGYKFDCVEQGSSRMLSICALQNILQEFNVPQMPSLEELSKIVQSSVMKIKRCQLETGAIGFWNIKSDINIYVSIFAAHALLRADLQGYKVDQTALNRGKSFCQNVERYFSQYCRWYGPHSRASLRSFALYVLAIFALNSRLTAYEKRRVVEQAIDLHERLENFLSHEGKAWLALALCACAPEKNDHPLVKKILHWIMNNVNETPETANFVTSYGDDGKLVMLHSNRRTDGVMLEVLIQIDPENYLIPKIVKGLLAHRKAGRWSSTQENVYILLALKRYFEVFEKLVPDFVARVWLGEEYCGQIDFHVRETDYKCVQIPMNTLLPNESEPGEQTDLVLWKQGQGRLYYRLGLDYAPRDLDLKPLDFGFSVERSYEGVTDPAHVSYDDETRVWRFKAGELVRVKLRMTIVTRRYHVALVDYIPAGCEIQNPDLKGGPELPSKGLGDVFSRSSSSPYQWCWWRYYRRWYEHVNRRDERVEVFASLVYAGLHEYEYLMSATSLGEFVVPPAKAEEMYAPELFGRSKTERVVVTLL